MRHLRTWVLIALVLAFGWLANPTRAAWDHPKCPVGQVLYEVSFRVGAGVEQTSNFCVPSNSLLDPFAPTN